MKSRFFDLNYHPSLVEIMLKGSFSGAFIVNIFTPLLLAYAFMPYINSSYLILWLILNALIYVVRIVLIKKIARVNYKENKALLINIKRVLLVVFLTALLYLAAILYSSAKVPDLELFLMGTLIVSMVAGSISTLVGVFHAFAIYVLLNSLSVVGVFFFHGGKLFEIFAGTTFIFMLVMLHNGYKQYLSLSENILLKESFETRVGEALQEVKNQNKKTKESLHNFQDLLNTSMVMIAFQSLSGHLISMNESALKKFGYESLEEIEGMHIKNVLPEKSLEIVKEALKQEVSEPYELIMKKKDGTEFPTLISAKYILLNGERVRMTTMMDLSELENSKKLLQHQSKLAQMGEMISMIAHQWRQPLSAISATSAALNLKAQLGKTDKESIVEMTGNISQYAQHLSETIDDFRNFFKPNKEKKDIYYDDILVSVYRLMETSLLNKNIKLIKNLECKESFKSYPSELKQVILNLVKNAEDILLERDIKNPYIKILTYKKDDRFILEVHDNGGGIDKEIIEKVFDPYFSTKLEKDGTGLGLYMSKMIIEEHCSGVLTVKNSQDGAVFKLSLAES